MRRALRFGLLWFIGLFFLDALSSYRELRKAFTRMEAEPDAIATARREVGVYVLHAMGSYVVMGLICGVLLHFLQQSFGGGPSRARAWIWAAGLTLWIYMRGAILWPLMHYGVPGLNWWCANVEPSWVNLCFALLALGAIGLDGRKNGLRPAWLALFLLGSALWGRADWQPPAPKPDKNKGLNVIVVGMDALRPDHLASFGYSRDTAPNLDRRLSDMAVFESAFTPEPRTWEAWMSILTGTYPVTHGKRWSLPAPGDELPEVPMLTEALREAGYHTRFITDDSRFSYMLPEHGFDVIDQPPIGFRAFAASRLQPNFRAWFTFLNGPLGWKLWPAYRNNQAYGITWRPDVFAEDVAHNIAEAARHDRFFITVHSCPLHTPADRPWPYHKMWGMGNFKGGNRFRYRSYGSAMVDGDNRDDSKVLSAEQRSRQQNLNLYDAGISMLDVLWERVDRALTEGDLWDNTLVIVLSDHGEDFLNDDTRYPFRGPNHGFHPWGTGQQRVVLGIWGPGFTAGRRAERVSLIDVAPTIARATGVDLPSAEGLPLQDPVPSRLLFGETGVGEPMYWPKGHMSVPFKSAQKRYTLDPETGRVYQKPELDESTIAAKDRWVFDDEFWLVQEPWEDGGNRYSLFKWREDPTFRMNVLTLYPDDARRLYAALYARPRFPGRPEVLEDPVARIRPASADSERSDPIEASEGEGDGELP